MQIVSRLGSRPHRLLESTEPSPGEVRKILLAMGITHEPNLIVMDEPTNHMDLPSSSGNFIPILFIREMRLCHLPQLVSFAPYPDLSRAIFSLALCPGRHRAKLRLRLKKTAAKGKKRIGGKRCPSGGFNAFGGEDDEASLSYLPE
jgi:hypothetical protein